MNVIAAALILLAGASRSTHPVAWACTPAGTQTTTVTIAQPADQVCVAFETLGPDGWSNRRAAMVASQRQAGPHCHGRERTGTEIVADQELNDQIARFFPPEAWEPACDTAWSESRFRLEARTRCCVGPFQMHRVHSWRAGDDPLDSWVGNVRAAASLWAEQGWRPWDGSSNVARAGA